MTTRAVLAVATVLCLVLAGCGWLRAAPTPTPNDPPVPGTDELGDDERPGTGPATSEPIQDDVPATDQRDEVAPADDTSVLAGQFTAFLGGVPHMQFPDCSDFAAELPDELPHVGTVSGDEHVSIGVGATLCLGGFAADAPIALAVQWPDGERTVTLDLAALDGPVDLRTVESNADPRRARTLVVPSTEGTQPAARSRSTGDVQWATLRWDLPPGVGPGGWVVTAAQGDVVATARMTAGPAADTVLRLEHAPDAGRALFRASGFPSGASAVGLYRVELPSGLAPGEVGEATMTLVDELDPLEVDASGAAFLEVDLGSHGPGAWCVVTSVTGEVCAGGVLTTT
ncbi:hypothetical protein [Salsipaludibacter albus]|uniref:hypothetical protein n=1 Tax=Salsipaludibacter albus TaxID=2849650 RepID=UPI001EE49694|nr:hypothetical protein [Salsipaludibacter albus]MBY5163487.1 hypothetical protein [Salsipaludibacter albus]